MQLQLQPQSQAQAQAQAQAEIHPRIPGAPVASRRLQHRPSKSEDLRPAPLRVPSTELKEPGSGSQPSAAALARKNSKWKPLPGVPGQQQQQLAPFTAQPQPRRPVIPPHSSSSQLDRPLLPTKALQDSLAPLVRRERDQIIVISTTLGSSSTPPLTPDSDAGGRAAAQPSSSSPSSLSSSRPAERRKERTPPPRDPRAQKPAVPAQKLLRHTRSERMWLHENYRGEAPFLSAWGLDIQRPEDRAEGLDILRDLIRSEARGGEVRGGN
ncbi:hypothetical protein B0T26DRAFT_186220 [Lasiosphaeria miniovina]|uniref:Uncharacterized protein n=1 Tax=Lasiosphaeria miniovina TaxID=1954250 RepID=A0AA40E8C9_9PEZI|nr:uncharacterized protein B0T26DRAFT_186220 [Lasiosphaeria miniovina]KAK0728842.1 hypothetical protein B0T26DRAFT_186220 [Lasiosphaeria miniovina]